MEEKYLFGNYETPVISNVIHSAKEFIKRKKEKSKNQTHKGSNIRTKSKFLPGGSSYTV